MAGVAHDDDSQLARLHKTAQAGRCQRQIAGRVPQIAGTVNECNRDFSTVTHSFRLSKHKVQAAGKVLGLLTILPESCWRLATSPEKLDCTTGVGRRVSHREPARRTETPRRSCCLGPPSGPPGLNGRVAGLYLLARRAARELEAGDAGLPTCCTGKLAS